MTRRLIVGITGATGAIYGVELLRTLKSLEDWESHVVLSDAAINTARPPVFGSVRSTWSTSHRRTGRRGAAGTAIESTNPKSKP